MTFLHDHRGMPIASPAVFEQISTRFRQAVARSAENNDIPMIKFKKGIRKATAMEPLLQRAARAGRSRVVAIGWAQEFQLVWDARKRDTDPARAPQFSFAKAERRVTCYYFYIWDEFPEARVHQGMRVLPVPGEGLAQRSVCRAFQAGSGQGRDRLHRAVQRVRPLR